MRYMPLPAQVFAQARARLTALLPPRSLAVLNANDVLPTNADGTLGFRQNSDLYYLSGIDQEEAVLVLFPRARDPKRREVLFVRETSDHLAIWEGAKLSKAQASELSGVETVFWTRDFKRIFREMMFEANTIFLPLNEHLHACNQMTTRSERFVASVRESFPLHEYARLAPLLYRLRMTKAPAEIEALRMATRATKAGFERVLRFVRPGVHEFEIEAELAHEYLRARSRAFSFAPIIASGANACVLHYIDNNAVCQEGDLLLLDCAAEYANYGSDMTRTIPVSGRFTPRQRQIYNAVLRVMRACSPMLRPGVMLADYEKEAKKIMESELIDLGLLDREAIKSQNPDDPLYRKYFMHGTSHHVGLDVHDVDDPALALDENMVLSVEPGIYIREESIGVRLENLIVIGQEKNEDLMADVPIEAEEIEERMSQS